MCACMREKGREEVGGVRERGAINIGHSNVETVKLKDK